MTDPAGPGPSLLGPAVVLAVIRRPDLWPTALRVGLRTATPGWWRRWPPRPVPPPSYVEFRLRTMYGADGGAGLGAAEAIGYLEWCRRHAGRRR